MRKAKVYRNTIFAGRLVEDDERNYSFEYESDYFGNDNLPAVSLTMPKTKRRYSSQNLFPFFFNMLSEGANRKIQSKQYQISENDNFGLLLATSSIDSIGAVMVKEEKEDEWV